MIILNQLKFFFFILFINSFVLSNVYGECSSKSKLKVGIIDNKYISYKYYLLYTLDNYSIENNIEFEIDYVNQNIDEFDIIFGEYHQLDKLSKIEIELPDKINNFYINNDIKLNNNLLPLDLDTFILLSKKNEKKLLLEDLSNYIDPFRYTIGMSFVPEENFIKTFLYSLEENSININSLNFESKIYLFNKIYKNQNKNILFSNYDEVFDSFENEENLYTVFSDGVLLYENLKYDSFQLFPKSKFFWNNDTGIFEKNEKEKPYSFFGFSAYISNFDQIGFLCYLVDENTRINSFKKFNINLSPLSMEELNPIKDEIPIDYINILKSKTNYIFDTNTEDNKKYYDLLMDIISGKYKYIDKVDNLNYLDFE